MTEITSKVLHEKTANVLDRARGGERFRILRNGRVEALVVPAEENKDPSWTEILADVRRLAKKGGPKKANPILEERKRRDYATRIR